jgi:hypothetical protein
MANSLDIPQMVFTRVPFLNPDDPLDRNRVESSIIEWAWNLNHYLKKPEEQVGFWQYYTYPERSLMAYVVAITELQTKALRNMTGTAGQSVDTGRQVRRAEAGEAKVEFETPKLADRTMLAATTAQMIAGYCANANTVAGKYGFYIDCSSGGIMVHSHFDYLPLLVTNEC